MNTELDRIRYWWDREETKPETKALLIKLMHTVLDVTLAISVHDDDAICHRMGEIVSLVEMLRIKLKITAPMEELVESAMYWIRKGERG
jgi:hypothetical protein